MRRSNTTKISEVIQDYLSSLNIDKKLKERQIIHSWEEVLGKNISDVTRNLYIKNGVLYISLNSSIVRHELLMLKTGLIKALNDKVGEEIIKDIRFS